MTEKKRIVVNAFDMTTTSHQSFGTWRHPRNRADEYNTIEYWTDLAKVCEKGLFDAILIADVVGVYDVYKNSVADALRDGAKVPAEQMGQIKPGPGNITVLAYEGSGRGRRFDGEAVAPA